MNVHHAIPLCGREAHWYNAPMGTALAVHAKRLRLPDLGDEAHSCNTLTGTISLSVSLLFGPLASQWCVWGVVLS